MLRSSSTTQAIVSLSSGESEFYSAVKGCSVAMGIKSLMKDMGLVLSQPILLKVDSTACLGMAGRKGAGRVRHIHTPCLWLQQCVASRTVELQKVLGTENPADLGTKVLSKDVITKIVKHLGFVSLVGRSRMALRAAVP